MHPLRERCPEPAEGSNRCRVEQILERLHLTTRWCQPGRKWPRFHGPLRRQLPRPQAESPLTPPLPIMRRPKAQRSRPKRAQRLAEQEYMQELQAAVPLLCHRERTPLAPSASLLGRSPTQD